MTDKNQGIIQMVLDGMHPTIKAILFGCLAFPLFLALSGMILNLNVGSIIQKKLDANSDQTVTAIESAMSAQVSDMSRRLDGFIDTSNRQNAELRAAMQAVSIELTRNSQQLSSVDERLSMVENVVDKISDWVCDQDGQRGLGSCALKGHQ